MSRLSENFLFPPDKLLLYSGKNYRSIILRFNYRCNNSSTHYIDPGHRDHVVFDTFWKRENYYKYKVLE